MLSITVFDHTTMPGRKARNAPAHPAQGAIHRLVQSVVYTPAMPANNKTTTFATCGDAWKRANAAPSMM
jgi:hypothetical protein